MGKSFFQSFRIQGKDYYDAGKASTEIKAILSRVGIDQGIIRRVAIAAYEAEMNVVMYARQGLMTIKVASESIKITIDDDGPGIPDVDLAMKEGYSTATDDMREMGFGAGMGLPNIKRNADEFRLESAVGVGTRLEIIIYLN